MKKHIARIAAAVLACAGVAGISPGASAAETAKTETILLNAGETVEITVKVKDNPGITTYGAWVGFDSSALTFVEAVDSKKIFTGSDAYFLGETTEAGNEVALLWVDGENDTTATGVAATLRFTAKTSGTSNITLTVDDSLAVDTTGTFKAVSSDDVAIWQGLLGDVNGDGSIDNADVIQLRRLIAGWNVTLANAGDINCDGEVDTADIVLLRRYVAEWDSVKSYFEF